MAAVECQVLRSQLCTILMLFYQKGSFRAQNLEPFRGSLVLTEVIHCNFIFRFSLLFATSEWYVKFISRKIIIMDRKSELLSNQLWKKAVCTRAWSMGCQTPSLFHLYFSNYKMFFCFISQSVRGQIAKKSGAQRLFFFSWVEFAPEVWLHVLKTKQGEKNNLKVKQWLSQPLDIQ